MEGRQNPPAPSPAPAAKSSRWRRLAQNLALSFAVFMLCAVVLEVILRFCGYGNLPIYEPDPVLYWKPAPNQDCYTKIGHLPVHINSLGTRGPEFTPDKPANTLRILSLGDSRTFGWGLRQSETYSDRLRQLLQANGGHSRKVEVINAGVNAWSYAQMLAYFRHTGLGFHPDIVILGEANLWTQFTDRNSPQFVRQFLWRVRLKNFLRRFAIYHYVVEVKLKSVYERYRTRFIPVDPSQDTLFEQEQQKDPDALFRAEIQDLCELALTNRVKPVLLYLPIVDELQSTNTGRTLNIKRQVAATLHVPLVDLTGALRPGLKALYLEGDPVHLNARGNEIVAEHLFQTVSRLTTP
jgi:lysophospholipase L1-like esterase